MNFVLGGVHTSFMLRSSSHDDDGAFGGLAQNMKKCRRTRGQKQRWTETTQGDSDGGVQCAI